MVLPTNLDDLVILLASTHDHEEVLGDKPEQNYRKLAKICHPDSYPDPEDKTKAERAYKKLQELQRQRDENLGTIEHAGISYEVKKLLGTGDLCNVLYASADGEGWVLKLPRISKHNKLVAKEGEALFAVSEASESDDKYDLYLPQIETSFVHDRRRINVFKWRSGYYTCEEIRSRYPEGVAGRHIAWMFRRVLEILGHVHRTKWVHGAILPPHVMYNAEDHGLQLVDWIHAEKARNQIRLAPSAFKEWYPPECKEKRPAGPQTDIYLAAKTMIYLAGGDPLSNYIPAAIPAKIRTFLKGCLVGSFAGRPADAWQLHKSFGEVLEDVYGPPKFVRLDMA